MRTALLLLSFLLVACGTPDDATPGDAPEVAEANAPDTSAPAASGDGAVDPALVGFWTQAYTQFSEGGEPVTYDTIVTWTLREDGTAQEAKISESFDAPLTEDLTWTRSGDRLGFSNAATGDERQQFDVVRLEGDTLTVQKVGENRFLTYARGPVNE